MPASPAHNNHSNLAAQRCYHCGLPVASGSNYLVNINGKPEAMCCPGCQAVATVIVDGGLENFYTYRTEINARSDLQALGTDWKIYDLPEVQSEFVTDYDAEFRQANLLLEGISCAACSWLIETHLKKSPAVKTVSVNVSTHRCTLVWSPGKSSLSELFKSLAQIGYKPRPATDDQQQEFFKKENRVALFRLGVAGFGMMQAMMVAVGIYFGATDTWLDFLRWLSMLVATPVVFFSASPFFKAAWRSIKSKHLIMDVPVALAIGLAYLASAWATITSSGEVYFESVSMFAFFLLLGRYIEQRARHRNRLAFGNLAQLMPLTACCVSSVGEQEHIENIPLKMLAVNDLVLVKAGDTFSCDGIIVSGESEVVEALITGESIPVAKKVGDKVIAGTLNGRSVLRVRVTATGSATQISAIERLAVQAADEKPKQVVMADKIARFFVGRLLVVCAGVFLFWWFKDPSRALWITLSVLVVTCPCALALAMPAALSAATANLRQRGFLVARGHVIETLPQITRVIFDKTGTLTQGQFCVTDVVLLGCKDREQSLAIATALEADSNHPIAQAFHAWKNRASATQVKQTTAAGVEGVINNELYRIGTPEFVAEIIQQPQQNLVLPDDHKLWLLLANQEGAVAWFGLEDEARPSAAQTVRELQDMGIAVELLSGDQSGAVAQLAKQLGMKEFVAGAKPADKLAQLNMAQLRGDKVLMVGDGINDVPVLAGADVSVAMASASDLAQTRADTVLLNNQLTLLPKAIEISRRTHKIIKQNLMFSLSYNLVALPLAAMGHVPPWAAAIGMTMSSLIVVLNALRLSK
ncbi:cation-transporting P-type ATPase [Cellvibrio zantedeschiae]|uniref:Cation-transporting P-type ATPase n=1 Tax=Cellvibrio zantedeschiae TaxID=1237077 RepID=A0ABQ3ASH7_9GAMM|nr:heavy metal translocating P-type ATPase [Cellvibrio zantedeschiae]GGY63204.1 cation-transporting P-type ATPase [Cellvibrio zantedeschiae]